MPKIIITVSPTGETTLETKGYAGASCTDASKPYEQALGIKTDDRKTAEYHANTDNRTRLGN